MPSSRQGAVRLKRAKTGVGRGASEASHGGVGVIDRTQRCGRCLWPHTAVWPVWTPSTVHIGGGAIGLTLQCGRPRPPTEVSAQSASYRGVGAIDLTHWCGRCECYWLHRLVWVVGVPSALQTGVGGIDLVQPIEAILNDQLLLALCRYRWSYLFHRDVILYGAFLRQRGMLVFIDVICPVSLIRVGFLFACLS